MILYKCVVDWVVILMKMIASELARRILRMMLLITGVTYCNRTDDNRHPAGKNGFETLKSRNWVYLVLRLLAILVPGVSPFRRQSFVIQLHLVTQTHFVLFRSRILPLFLVLPWSSALRLRRHHDPCRHNLPSSFLDPQ